MPLSNNNELTVVTAEASHPPRGPVVPGLVTIRGMDVMDGSMMRSIDRSIVHTHTRTSRANAAPPRPIIR
jgi:hypothetical protein